MTGAGDAATSVGRHTFRFRQSSLIGKGPTPGSPCGVAWMQIGP